MPEKTQGGGIAGFAFGLIGGGLLALVMAGLLQDRMPMALLVVLPLAVGVLSAVFGDRFFRWAGPYTPFW